MQFLKLKHSYLNFVELAIKVNSCQVKQHVDVVVAESVLNLLQLLHDVLVAIINSTSKTKTMAFVFKLKGWSFLYRITCPSVITVTMLNTYRSMKHLSYSIIDKKVKVWYQSVLACVNLMSLNDCILQILKITWLSPWTRWRAVLGGRGSGSASSQWRGLAPAHRSTPSLTQNRGINRSKVKIQ